MLQSRSVPTSFLKSQLVFVVRTVASRGAFLSRPVVFVQAHSSLKQTTLTDAFFTGELYILASTALGFY